MATSDIDTVRKDMEKQIADLKKEVSQLSKSLAERRDAAFEDIRDNAQDAYETASNHARGAVRQVRRQSHVVSDAIRENPGTAATVLSSAGLVGFLVGIVVGQALTSSKSHRWY